MAWFIIEFLKGQGSGDSPKIAPDVGIPRVDIHFEYKNVFHWAQARDAVERQKGKRINRGLPAYSEVEYSKRSNFFSNRIHYQLFPMRYASFTRYFGHLKRLGWVEESGITERSSLQDDYTPAPFKVFYNLTAQGEAASPVSGSIFIEWLCNIKPKIR